MITKRNYYSDHELVQSLNPPTSPISGCFCVCTCRHLVTKLLTIIIYFQQVNSLNSGFQWNGSLSVPEMKALDTQMDPCLKPEADFKFFIAYDFYPLDNPFMHKGGHYGFNQVSTCINFSWFEGYLLQPLSRCQTLKIFVPNSAYKIPFWCFLQVDRRQRVFTPQLNHISMKLPPFPLMVELDAASQLDFCNSSTTSNDCSHTFCECTHVLRVPLGAVAEIILVDKGEP